MDFMEQAFIDQGLEREQQTQDFSALGDKTKVVLGTIRAFYRNKSMIYYKPLDNNSFSIEHGKRMMKVTVVADGKFTVEETNLLPESLNEKQLGRAVLSLCGDPNG